MISMHQFAARCTVAGSIILCVSMMAIATGCTTIAYVPAGEAVSTKPALRPVESLQTIRESLDKASAYNWNLGCRTTYEDVRVDFNQLSFTIVYTAQNKRYEAPPKSVTAEFRKLRNLRIVHWSGFERGYHTVDDPGTGGFEYYIQWEDHNFAYARRFVDAARAIQYYISGHDVEDDSSSFTGFQQEAQVWRALLARPPLPEDVRQARAVAEDAVQKREFEKAIDYYERGLRCLPLWPEGLFNVALLYGELGLHGQAINHMRRYVELMPDAPDARAARDQIAIWMSKLPRTGTGR